MSTMQLSKFNLHEIHNNQAEFNRQLELLSFKGLILTSALNSVNYELDGLRGLLPLAKLEHKLELQEQKRKYDAELRLVIAEHLQLMKNERYLTSVEYRKELFPEDGDSLINEAEIALDLIGYSLTLNDVVGAASDYYNLLKQAQPILT